MTEENTTPKQLLSPIMQLSCIERQVRENVRNAMRQKPYMFNTLDEALKWISGRFQIPMQRWIMRSELLKNALFQKKITDFFGKQHTT